MANGNIKNSDGKIEIYKQFQLLENVSAVVINYFGAKKRVKEFLTLVTETASVALVANRMQLSPLEIYQIIESDP